MPFTGKNHPEIQMDNASDAHGQDSLNMRGGEYVNDPGFAARLAEMGWTAPWTDDDSIYVRTHSGRGGRSLMAIISKYITDNGLRQGGATAPPATGEPAPGPTPTPGPAPAPVGRTGAFDELEVAIGHMGLGDGSGAAASEALTALEAGFNAAVKKIRNKIVAGSAWEAAVNTGRLSDLFGTTSRYTQHQLETQPLQKRAWEAALGLPFSEEGSSTGIGIAGGVKP